MPQLNEIAKIPIDGFWAIEPMAWEGLCKRMESLSVEAMRLPAGWQAPNPLSIVEDGIAVVSVTGPMTKRAGIYQVLFDASAYETIGAAIDEVAGNSDIKAVLLRMDSPGGTVDGIAELTDKILNLRQTKPVWVQGKGTIASAAYFIASQANQIFAGRMDTVGSIGVRSILYDYSRMFANIGIEAVTIDTGAFKSMGAMGTEITAEHRKFMQEFIDAHQKNFLAGITRGRTISQEQLAAAADGRFWVAEEALSMGLIDGIGTFNQTIGQLRQLVATKKPLFRRSMKMPELETAPPVAASYQDLVAACPGASSDFLCKQLEKKATTEQARQDLLADRNAEVARLGKEKTDLEAALKEKTDLEEKLKAKITAAGVEALGGNGTIQGLDRDVAAEWNTRLNAKIAAGMRRDMAVRSLVREDKALHTAFVEAANADR